jgi:uncharacterized protein
MILRKIIFIIILFLSSNLICLFGQNYNEIRQFSNLFEHEKHKDEFVIARNNTNEIQLLFSGLFLAYKHFISSQDVASCVFYPSCSVFALQAIKKQGLLPGVLNAFDRLTRCNPLSPEKYEKYQNTGLLYDPVEIRKDKKVKETTVK